MNEFELRNKMDEAIESGMQVFNKHNVRPVNVKYIGRCGIINRAVVNGDIYCIRLACHIYKRPNNNLLRAILCYTGIAHLAVMIYRITCF